MATWWRRCVRWVCSRLAWVAAAALLATQPLYAACSIPSTPCYPWRIEAGKEGTVLLEIVPNNAPTGAIYRICLCPPSDGVSLVFDFEGRKVELGQLEPSASGTVCRDWRIQTARKSRLWLNRRAGSNGMVDGCYATQ